MSVIMGNMRKSVKAGALPHQKARRGTALNEGAAFIRCIR
jgi:hypothetical protein